MTAELVAVVQRKYRAEIPELHRASLDTRIQWLWNQRFGTIQTIWQNSRDPLDVTAAMMFLQAIMAKDLETIAQIFQRLEGGPLSDEQNLGRADQPLRV